MSRNRAITWLALGGSLSLCAAVARAQSTQPAREHDPADDAAQPVTDAALDAAPPPHEADGYVVAPIERETPAGERAVRYVPRLVTKVVLAPARLAFWLEDRFQGEAAPSWQRYGDLHFEPVARWDVGRSSSIGSRITHRDLGGGTGAVEATAGTRDRVVLDAELTTGKLLGPATALFGWSYRETAEANFYGIGDRSDAPEAAYGVDEQAVRAGAALRLADRVEVTAIGSLRRLTFEDPESWFGDTAPPVTEVYDPMTLTGYMDGVDAARGALSLLVDRRGNTDTLQSIAAPSRGWATQMYAGLHRGVGDDPTRFAYAGIDAIGYVDLYRGNRTLSLRLTVDAALGERERIPFVDLPTLGGAYHLRGYSWGRFRDRWAAAASLEYSWPVHAFIAAFAFVDAGRVAGTAEALDDISPRISGGIGLQAHSRSSYLMRTWIATTDEGGVMTYLSLEPSFGLRAKRRVR